MDLDVLILANSVKAADSLLYKIGAGRKVKHNQLVGELKVPAFAADLRADEDLSTSFFVSEEVRRSVPGNQVHTFVERGGTDGRFVLDVLLESDCSFRSGTDYKDFLG